LRPNSLNQVFATLKRSINATTPEQYVASVKKAFLDLRDSQRFPRDPEFFNAFGSYKLYGKQRCKYILGLLENYDNEEPINPQNYRVERVMPSPLLPVWGEELGFNAEEIHKQYADTIANLTLVEHDLLLRDNSFVFRRNNLRNSNLRLNAYICDQDKWTKDTIVNRKNVLWARASKIWSENGREGIVIIPMIPLLVPEIAEHLNTRIMDLAPERIYTAEVGIYGGYTVNEYRTIAGENIVAVIEMATQVNIYPKIDSHEVSYLLAELEAYGKPVTYHLHPATTYHNGNFKIVLPNQSTDYDIDIVMEIIKNAFESL